MPGLWHFFAMIRTPTISTNGMDRPFAVIGRLLAACAGLATGTAREAGAEPGLRAGSVDTSQGEV
jgi:hypothetical protein